MSADLTPSDATARLRAGWAFGLSAYLLWGLMPFYFKAVQGVPAEELLAHRILWAIPPMALALTLAGRWAELVNALRTPELRNRLFLSTLLIGGNWLVFLYCVITDRVLQTSLGYFMSPLVSVGMGVVLLGEPMRLGRVAAFVLAAVGVAILVSFAVAGQGQPPWLALSLAVTFSSYGLVRRATPVDGLAAVSAELLLLAPFMVGVVIFDTVSGRGTFGSGESRFEWLLPSTDWLVVIRLEELLAVSGIITVVPLVCFGQAAQRLPLSTLGFLQYISPSMTFVMATFLFGESLGPAGKYGFPLIWAGLAVYTADTVLASRPISAAAPTTVEPADKSTQPLDEHT